MFEMIIDAKGLNINQDSRIWAVTIRAPVIGARAIPQYNPFTITYHLTFLLMIQCSGYLFGIRFMIFCQLVRQQIPRTLNPPYISR